MCVHTHTISAFSAGAAEYANCRGLRQLLHNKCPQYDTKPSDDEVPCGVPLHCHYSLVHTDSKW